MSKATRRDFLTTMGVGAIVIPINGLLMSRSAQAQDAPKLDEADPQAQALGYIHQSENAEQLCKGCQLYQGESDSEWGPCAIFQGKVVSANGWCKSWVAKAG